jgi:hypothetical protein
MHRLLAAIWLFGGLEMNAADYPSAEISNGEIRAMIYLPDQARGFYRGTRFDWSGMIGSLEYKGHNYYGPWFDATDPNVKDFIYSDKGIVTGPCSSATGPAEEFSPPLGYQEAKPGGTFIKVGVGVLRKPDAAAYDHYRLYEVVDSGNWQVRKTSNSVEFVQTINDASSGFGYTYRKTVRLLPGKPELVIEHAIKNTGKKPIDTTMYNHNFLVVDKRPPGPGLVISLPYAIKTDRQPEGGLAAVKGNELVYLKPLQKEDRVTTSLRGFGASVSDYEIKVEYRTLGAGVKITGNRPLVNSSLWSIRSVVSPEPFNKIAVEPGSEFTWSITNAYYTMTPAKE